MKRATFNVLFVVKKSKTTNLGESPVFVRVTVDGIRSESSISAKTDPGQWNASLGKSLGADKVSQELNNRLEVIRVRMMQIYRDMEMDGKRPHPKEIIDIYFGRDNKPKHTLVGLFREHNEKCRQLSGIDMSPATVERYATSLKHTQEFMKHTYGIEDIELRKVGRRFVEDYEFYLKTVRKCNHNSTMKYLKNFKKIIRIALVNKYMTDDPFAGIKMTLKEVDRDFLEEPELRLLEKKKFAIKRLDAVRDIYLFCCYTGLAFSDVQGLAKSHICTDNTGAQWIRKPRQKTRNMCNIPLLKQAQSIIKKYRDYANSTGYILPVPSNQKMNAYLREIAEICGINKQLTTHTARHTFATVVCLANGVSMDNVAKMLGHSDTKMTRHYAKVLDSSIMKDMKKVQMSM